MRPNVQEILTEILIRRCDDSCCTCTAQVCFTVTSLENSESKCGEQLISKASWKTGAGWWWHLPAARKLLRWSKNRTSLKTVSSHDATLERKNMQKHYLVMAKYFQKNPCIPKFTCRRLLLQAFSVWLKCYHMLYLLKKFRKYLINGGMTSRKHRQ